MPRIVVDTEHIKLVARGFEEVCSQLRQAIERVDEALAHTPEIESDFDHHLQTIGDESWALADQISDELKASSAVLTARAEDFETTETASLIRLARLGVPLPPTTRARERANGKAPKLPVVDHPLFAPFSQSQEKWAL